MTMITEQPDTICVGDVVEGIATYPRTETREVVVGRVLAIYPNVDMLTLDGGATLPLRPGHYHGANWAIRVVRPALPTRARSVVRVFDSNTLEQRVAMLSTDGRWYWAMPGPDRVPLQALRAAEVLHDVELVG